MGKPPGGSLPVFSAHSFARNCQLVLRESAEQRNKFSMTESAGHEGQSLDCLHMKRTRY